MGGLRPFAGNMVISAINGDGETIALTQEEVVYIQNQWKGFSGQYSHILNLL